MYLEVLVVLPSLGMDIVIQVQILFAFHITLILRACQLFMFKLAVKATETARRTWMVSGEDEASDSTTYTSFRKLLKLRSLADNDTRPNVLN